MLSSNLLQAGEDKEKIFRRECINFYIKATSYLKSHLPEAPNAISSLASVMEKRLADVFEISNLPKEQICDVTRSRWMLYQKEEIPEEYYLKKEVAENSTSGNSRSQDS